MAKNKEPKVLLKRIATPLMLFSVSLSSCGISANSSKESESSLSEASSSLSATTQSEESISSSESSGSSTAVISSEEESSGSAISSKESSLSESSEEESSREEFSSSEESSVSSSSESIDQGAHVCFSVNDTDFGSLKGTLDQTLESGETITKVEAVPKLGYRFVSWSDGNTSSIRQNESFSGEVNLVAIFDYDALEMPIFSIYTDNRTPITSKETYVPGELAIHNSDGHDEEGMELGIRGRGNYSWSGTEKKSYRIKFDSKTNLLGQGKGKCKSWTLLAVHCDKTLLRNDAAFHFARQLPSLPFTSTSSFVELYLNGKYDGVYEVCDQMQVNPYRVNIDDSGEEEDIGYFLEVDKNASEDVIRTDNGMTFELKSEYANQAQVNYITNYLNETITALNSRSRRKIDMFLNIPSLVESYIVEELFKNLDVGWGSFYLTKPKGEKMSFGPVWDFDLCAGNAENDDYDPYFKSPYYTYVGSDYYRYEMQQSEFFLKLRETSWFMNEVRDRYNELEEELASIVPHIEMMSSSMSNSFNRNFDRWKIFSKKINREPSEVLAIKTFQGQVDYLTDWLNKRIVWLGDFLNGKVDDLNYIY